MCFLFKTLFLVYQSNEAECSLLMQSFYSKQLPSPTQNSSAVTCGLNDRRIFFYPCPRDDRLNHDYYSALLSYLSPQHIVHLFESILCSKRILIYSRYASRLTKCCLALSNLIYPFVWPYPFVSLMPSSWLQDLMDSPCPFLYGCLRETIQTTTLSFEHDIIQVDLDLNMIDDFTDRTHVLPINIRQTFESSLEYLAKYRLIKMNSNLLNIAMSEACLNVLVELFYRLPDFFVFQNSAPKNDDEQISRCSKSLNHSDCGADADSFVSIDLEDNETDFKEKQAKSEFDYNFDCDEFINVQPKSYVSFLKGFTTGRNRIYTLK